MNKPKKPVRLNVKKGDTVVILSGKDRGQTGEILEAFPRDGKVTVAERNLVVRHQKPRRDNPFGQMQQGKVQKPAPLFASKVMLLCPRCGKATRPHRVAQSDGRLARICKKCDQQID